MKNSKHFLALLGIFLFSTQMISQEISVFSGFWAPKYYQDDVEISRKEAKNLLLNYEPSATYWKKKMTNETLFYSTYVVALGGAIWLGAETGRDRDDIAAPAAVTLGGLVVSLIFWNGANKNAKKAILTYNKQFDNKTTTYRLVPIGNSNGLGLALQF